MDHPYDDRSTPVGGLVMRKWLGEWYYIGFECAAEGESIPFRSKVAHFLIYRLGMDWA